MSESVGKPQIRFKGFTDTWEQRKFGEIFNFERPDNYTVLNTHYLKQGIPVLTANKSFILGYTNESGVYDKGNCIIFDDFTLDSKYVDFPFKISSSGIKILTSTSDYNLKFAYYLLSSSNILMQGHARHYISIVQPYLTNVPVVNEQNKIGKFITSIDNLITLHQRKYEKLVNVKKSLLEKMFPCDGENTPKIRFKGFSDAWEQRKLNEITKYCVSSMSVDKVIENGKYDVYDANEKIGFTNNEHISVDYLTIIKDGSGVGRVRKLPKNTYFIGTMGGILADNSNIDFINCIMQRFNFGLHINGATIPPIVPIK